MKIKEEREKIEEENNKELEKEERRIANSSRITEESTEKEMEGVIKKLRKRKLAAGPDRIGNEA